MAATTNPFTFRCWPVGDKGPKDMGEFITRINAERGGFRNVVQADLRQEISVEETDVMDVDEASDSEDDDSEALEADKSYSAINAREELLMDLEAAHQSTMLCLDFISLLSSKVPPPPNMQKSAKTWAGDTVSPVVKEIVGISTIGATKLKTSGYNEKREEEDLAVATGWRIGSGINVQTNIDSAAEKLEKELALETKYWDDILAVSDNGWAVGPLPHEPHTLGVRFGFAESAAEFKNSSIAPLRRNDDGSVRLEIGRVGRGFQRVRVTRKENGIIVDQSPLPGKIPDDAPLQERVLEARNTAFHQELWYEINREARTLLSADIYADSSSVTWRLPSGAEIIFTLEDLDEPENTHENVTNAQFSCTAQSILMQFLLFQGHRQNYNRRTTMTQVPNRVALQQPYSILRVLITNAGFFRECQVMSDYLEDLVGTMKRAGISTASLKSLTQPVTPPQLQNGSRRNPKMELNFINYLVGRLESAYELTITPDIKLFPRGRPIVIPFPALLFCVSLTPFSPNSAVENNSLNGTGGNASIVTELFRSGEQSDGPPNPLESLYPPADPARDPYKSAREAIHYIQKATSRALALKLAEETSKQLGKPDIGIAPTARSPASITDGKDIEAQVHISKDAIGRLVLSLDAYYLVGKKPAARSWSWKASGEDANGETIAAVLAKVIQGQVY
ncbi:hypothetical protein M426DRAFT_8825 [Hypoxylon sp. CI-4A]|nr:hypothetical protein M426DRAFT_8825 [Hypoxylon sp. CI-4A]